MGSDTRFRILLVEDEAPIRRALETFLSRLGHVTVACDCGKDAQSQLDAAPFDLVLTDVQLPDISGLTLVDHVRKSRDHRADVILMTGFYDESYAMEAMHHGAYDFFVKPLNFDKLRLTIDRVREKQSLERDRERLALLAREHELQMEMTMALSCAAEERDRSNRGHGQRTAIYAGWLGKRLCFTEEKQKTLKLAALLHDIGKIGIDDAILNKPGPLTSAEERQMRYHSEIGVYIIRPVSVLHAIEPIVRHHHEHWDGTGYPDGLAGEAIPIDARIVAIADYYDAITSERPYRRPIAVDDAIGILRTECAKKLDPTLTRIFIDIVLERESAPATAPTLEARA